MANKKLPKYKIFEICTEKAHELQSVISILESRLDGLVSGRTQQLQLLKSVVVGLYEELDKLAKKSPAEPVTDLALNQVNDVIRDIKQLVSDDSYVQKLNEFIAAGDNPEYRDTVVVLRQLRQGLDRFESQRKTWGEDLKKKLDETKFLGHAIQYYFDHEVVIYKSDFHKYGGEYIYNSWLESDQFNFTLLNDTNLSEHFSLNESDESET